ncbi:MAG: hypothetical protein ACO3GP_04325 [Candidatus Limnocylindrus sp.]
MAGYGNRGGGGRVSGGSSVAAGRTAKSDYQMAQANKRFANRKGDNASLPEGYAPRFTRRR